MVSSLAPNQTCRTSGGSMPPARRVFELKPYPQDTLQFSGPARQATPRFGIALAVTGNRDICFNSGRRPYSLSRSRFDSEAYRKMAAAVDESLEDLATQFPPDDLLDLYRLAECVGFKVLPGSLADHFAAERGASAGIFPPGTYEHPFYDVPIPPEDIYMFVSTWTRASRLDSLDAIAHELCHVLQHQKCPYDISPEVGELLDKIKQPARTAFEKFVNDTACPLQERRLERAPYYRDIQTLLEDARPEDLAGLKRKLLDEVHAHRFAERYFRKYGLQDISISVFNNFHIKWNMKLLWLIGQVEQRKS